MVLLAILFLALLAASPWGYHNSDREVLFGSGLLALIIAIVAGLIFFELI